MLAAVVADSARRTYALFGQCRCGFCADDEAALPNEGEAFGRCQRDKLGLLPLPPNSGLPEFGTLSRPKSDESDFG
jgi:hypothetical protein